MFQTHILNFPENTLCWGSMKSLWARPRLTRSRYVRKSQNKIHMTSAWTCSGKTDTAGYHKQTAELFFLYNIWNDCTCTLRLHNSCSRQVQIITTNIIPAYSYWPRVHGQPANGAALHCYCVCSELLIPPLWDVFGGGGGADLNTEANQARWFPCLLLSLPLFPI